MNDSEKLDLIIEKVSTLENKISGVEASLDDKISNIEASLNNKISDVEASLNNKISDVEVSLNNKISDVEDRTSNVEISLGKRISNIELLLENEISKNIKIIAEGHLDLSRKLNECVKLASDIKAKQELQDIYINMHEDKLKVL